MSRALARLRTMFKDPLLVRSTHGLCLTSRADEIYQPLRSILTDINQLIIPQSFIPSLIEKEIIIATRDYETTMILPKIINIVAKEAPGISIRVISLLGDDLSPLECQEVDFVLAGSESKASTLCRYTLFKENFVCLVSKNHPISQSHLTLKEYLSMKHCLVTIKNVGHGVVDTILNQKKLKRRITVRVPHFLAAAHVVAESDLIITLPFHLGQYLSQQMKIVMLKPPIKLPSFPIYLYWHIRNQHNPINKWLRQIIRLHGQA